MTLRILLVTDVYPPLIGGVERQMQILGKQLVRRGHVVGVATPWQVGFAERENDQGVQVHRLKGLTSRVPWFSINPQRRHHPPVPDPGTVWGLRRVINQLKPDVIHAYGWITYSCAVALVGKNVPLLLSVREYGYTCALRTMMRYGKYPCDGPSPVKCLHCATSYYSRPKGFAATVGVWSGRALLRWKTHGVHSVSSYMQANIRHDLFGTDTTIRDWRGRPLPDVVIPSFRTDESTTDDCDTETQAYLSRLPDQPFILFVGALRQVKGIMQLLRAYQRLEAPPPLVLLGVPAPDTPSRFPPNVTVLHNVPHRVVMAAWKRALFGVAPSIWPEPFGSVIHEAMSKGKAVIGTARGGQTDMIIENVTGLLVPPDNIPALADAMQQLINDDDLREKLGRAAYERAKLFTAESVVPQFERLYKQLMGMESELLHHAAWRP